MRVTVAEREGSPVPVSCKSSRNGWGSCANSIPYFSGFYLALDLNLLSLEEHINEHINNAYLVCGIPVLK